jgi:hypothetical protein
MADRRTRPAGAKIPRIGIVEDEGVPDRRATVMG